MISFSGRLAKTQPTGVLSVLEVTDCDIRNASPSPAPQVLLWGLELALGGGSWERSGDIPRCPSETEWMGAPRGTWGYLGGRRLKGVRR